MNKISGNSQSSKSTAYKTLFLILTFFLPTLSCAAAVVEKEKVQETKKSTQDKKKTKEAKKPSPPKIGNFALPSPQRPGGLLSFGQHVLDKDQAQLSLFFDYFSGVRKHLTEIVPIFLYGVTDEFSIDLTVPITPSFRGNGQSSSGLEDIFIQGEYQFYEDKTSTYEEGATLVASLTFPSGSTNHNPPTGLGASSPFFGFTCFRMYADWFGFLSDGILIPARHHGTKFGSTFFYQGGIGRNILYIESDLTLAWLAELNGFYIQKSKVKYHTVPDSGSNTLYLTPSLQLCTEKLTLQLGFGFPLFQQLNGNQTKNKYLLSSNIILTF